MGDNMKNSKDVLSSILKTAQMGQTGIRAVMHKELHPKLDQILRSQKLEYDGIEKEAKAIAASKNLHLQELSSSAKTASTMYTKMNLSFGDVNSKVAAMMMQGNTRGLIKTLKNLHHYDKPDPEIVQLSKKLIAYEQANIQQTQGFV